MLDAQIDSFKTNLLEVRARLSLTQLEINLYDAESENKDNKPYIEYLQKKLAEAGTRLEKLLDGDRVVHDKMKE